MITFQLLRKSISHLLFTVTALFILTGLGITNYKIIQPITLSILSKPVSHLIHTNLVIPFVTLLFLHMFISMKPKIFKKIITRFTKK